ncbi:MAG: hypothetical protein V7751_02600 [Pseudoalteromonas distincta]|jgi:hypothetical protein|uniref:hypothetical protein n=1 Tax=Halopseudomonas aestusnigri TaxID=857252 RepID=UPI000C450100|nr:hypothetical protein [Halopseudomonas aestusnigri]MBB32023.1 hypothetical protein [Gemmatimonadota bacterium]MCC4262776.1 hypothetical protein [Halopseudomonas aestusnigri]|tara:strand:+ start:2223 stop:2612 length:390 start_codon:yes stop_codon:yes gene_type:complete
MSEDKMLQRFQQEVLSSGPEATLPANLSHFWLKELQQCLDRYFENLSDPESTEDEQSMALPLAAVLHILFAQNGSKEVEVSLEKVFRNFEDYRLELALEEISRVTHIKTGPATLDSIFTNRDVVVENRE